MPETMATGRVIFKFRGQGLLALSLCLVWAQAEKLLVIPADGSHWTGLKPLVEELGRRGNQVVVVIPEVSGSMGPSAHCTTLTFPVPYTKEQLQKIQRSNLDQLMSLDHSNALTRMWSYFRTLGVLRNYTINACESLLYNKEMMQTLRDLEFDAILSDPFEPLGVIVAEYLAVPSVYIQSGLPCSLDFVASQCPLPSSYVPYRFSHYTDRMTLGQRTVNVIRALLEPLSCRYLYSAVDELASDFLQKETSMVEMMSKASLWLMRSDFAFEFPRPLMPNMVMVGGMNCEGPSPLPLVGTNS